MKNLGGCVAVILLWQCLSLSAHAASASSSDATADALTKCLDDPAHGSTGDQDECETQALKSYDKRMNGAYSKLLKMLPAEAAKDLKAAQRAWVGYRDLEARARDGLFATRQGTMYAPMEAGTETDLTKDRTLLLENYVRILEIDGQ